MDTHIVTVNCPACWEPVELEADPSVERQRYVEDCPVCCRPMEVEMTVEPNGTARAAVRPGNG